VVGVASAVLETAKVGIAHEADVAGVGALDHHDVAFVEVLALVDEFHGNPIGFRVGAQEYHSSVG
jgi:hypothetical protein